MDRKIREYITPSLSSVQLNTTGCAESFSTFSTPLYIIVMTFTTFLAESRESYFSELLHHAPQ